jgi:tRNA(Ile)-lysidine synthase
MKYLYQPFRKNIEDSNLINPGNTIIAAFSGGKDSLTLLLLLKELQKDLDFQLTAAYFNHNIRKDAQVEEQWIKKFCTSIKIELAVGGGDVPAYKKKHKLNLENAASMLRSRFLGKVAAKYETGKIATAHSRSDLTETFFIKLLRGSGSRGLSAIYSRVGEDVIRPLLIFSQKDIFSFLARNKIKYYLDYSNEQNVFLRNKIRHILIPEIEKIEPDIDDRIFKTVTLIRDEYEYFTETAAAFLKDNLILNMILPVETLKNTRLALQRHILREYIRLLKGNLLDIDFEHVENIITGISKSKGIAIPGLELKFHKGFIYPKNISIPDYNYVIDSPGAVELKEIHETIILEEGHSYKSPANNFEIVVPYSSLKFPLTVRSPRKKDKYTKLNSSFKLRVFEMIREAGFPAELRNLCPVLTDGDGLLIWVAGSPAAEPFKVVDKKGKRFLNIYKTF